MNTVTLKTDGRMASGGRIVAGEPLMFLGHKVRLATDYTLRSFFRMFEKYTVLDGLSVFLPACLERYRICAPTRCDSADIDHLEFNKTVEMIGFPGEPRLEIYNSLCAVRGKETCELKALPLENLLDLPLRLGTLKHVIFGDKVDVFEFETVFSLFEFIDGIVWELSFQGTPKECAI